MNPSGQASLPLSGHDATQCSPGRELGSILRASPAPPLRKVRGAVLILYDMDLADFIARELRRDRSHAYKVIQGQRVSPPLQEEIAKKIKARVEDIWPVGPKLAPGRPGWQRERGEALP